jgi:uncharacterized membrane protein YsdA (DUF1294 family)
MDPLVIAIIIIAAWNAAVFAVYGIDKRRAKRGRWRISEGALLLMAALMGGVGAFLGMLVFHHKTKRRKFMFGVPLLLVMNTIVAAGCLYLRALKLNLFLNQFKTLGK